VAGERSSGKNENRSAMCFVQGKQWKHKVKTSHAFNSCGTVLQMKFKKTIRPTPKMPLTNDKKMGLKILG